MSESPMTHRERVLAALGHEQPDRVPLDLGSTVVTGISLEAYDSLKQYLGLNLGKSRVFSKSSQIAVIDEEIRDLFGIDTRGFLPGQPNTPPVEEKVGEEAFLDEWGVVWRKPASANTYSVGGAPLAGELSEHAIRAHPWPDPDDPVRTKSLRRKVRAAANAQDDRAVVVTLPGNFILTSQNLRGFSRWMLDVAMNPRSLSILMDQVLEVQMAICGNILDSVEEWVDVFVNLDDLAFQDQLMISPASYDELLRPRMSKFYRFVRSKTDAKIMHHTDGAVEPLLDTLIEMGIDAVNPLQVSAEGMGDVQRLKTEYGDRLAFWGGVDTHRLLPDGSAEEVRSEVRRLVERLNCGGGYVLCAVHNIQGDVPPDNIIAMYEAALGERILVPTTGHSPRAPQVDS